MEHKNVLYLVIAVLMILAGTANAGISLILFFDASQGTVTCDSKVYSSRPANCISNANRFDVKLSSCGDHSTTVVAQAAAAIKRDCIDSWIPDAKSASDTGLAWQL